jgi:hypothetical protein
MLGRAVTAHETFYKEVMPLVSDTTGEKGGMVDVLDVLGEVLAPLIESITTIDPQIDPQHLEEDRLTRKTIQTQLEATKWLAFASIPR